MCWRTSRSLIGTTFQLLSLDCFGVFVWRASTTAGAIKSTRDLERGARLAGWAGLVTLATKVSQGTQLGGAWVYEPLLCAHCNYHRPFVDESLALRNQWIELLRGLSERRSQTARGVARLRTGLDNPWGFGRQ